MARGRDSKISAVKRNQISDQHQGEDHRTLVPDARRPSNKAIMADGTAQASKSAAEIRRTQRASEDMLPPSPTNFPPRLQEVTFNTRAARKWRRKKKAEKLNILLKETEQLQKMTIFITA